VRVDVAVRPAKAHREKPALARMHRLVEQRRAFFAPRIAIPREQQLFRQALIRGLHR
jgi:hypothetical protein